MCAAVVVIVILLFLIFSSAAAASRINPTSSLTQTTNSTWLSSSGIFAMGFYHTPDGYAVCIFFDKSKTVVWTANRDNPIVPNNVDLLLTDNGLVLQLSETQDTYSWVAKSSTSVAWASMLDNGNFVLYNSSGSAIWQSFDHPTDTLLPGQRLSPGAELLSKASETDLQIGIFRLKMQIDGNLVLYSVDTLDVSEDAYYSSGTNGGGNNVSLNLEVDGRLYLFNGSSVLQNLTTGGHSVNGTIYLMRIDVEGIFRVYNQSLLEDNWTPMWEVTDDKCLPKGLCGINSCCTYQNKSANCKCLPGYDPVRSGIPSPGCSRNFVVDGRDKDQSSKFEMKRMQNVTWEDNYYSVLNGTSEEGCAKACLEDWSCYVALFTFGQCRKQKLPLRYGKWLNGSQIVALVRAPKSDSGSPGPSEHKKRLSHLQKRLIIGVSVAILISSIIMIYYITRKCGWWCNLGKKQNIDKFLLAHGSLAPKRYSYNEIKKMSKSFKDKLGQGGYGIVYKGKLPDGQLVAVKVLTETHDNAEEFINEVASISRTSHVNIVNLLGFCYERNKRALVYEFMPNKSLEKFIYKSPSLEWKKLYEIAVGVARGLEYLHRGCNTRIVHFDIKPQNILLDQDFCPKISDFGLAKLCMRKQSVISMLGARGTIGYIAPEVFSRNFGIVSHKSDVYSYGIMLLQMAKEINVEPASMKSSENCYLDKVYEHVVAQKGRILDDVMSQEEAEESGRKMVMVGFWCIQTSPLDRPSMSNVVEMLQGKLQSIQIPPKPFLLCSPKPKNFIFHF
ncbi:receptor serine/threonine kinase [Perilla frutescens var. hirtella]|nr:receptor serine/threonine kinase [Perilla frutescens var. frutescens]KAH6784642.1 receptor serine/threonine kinase [Perilla frutescens var. hirtella]